jgi:hypothetical protein
MVSITVVDSCCPYGQERSVKTKLKPIFQAGDVVEHVKNGKSYLILVVTLDKCLLKEEGVKRTPKWIPTSNFRLGPSLP